MSIWWISFANDDGFLGGILAEGENLSEICQEAGRRGCNPGGEVAGFELERPKPIAVARLNKWRLYSRAELEQLGMQSASVPDSESETSMCGQPFCEWCDDLIAHERKS